ncbi:alpha/beta fold hydrolase [Luteolibacter marinus]|uniref:alpha/beta fold hydrolase n=1 Tax=Luteolibacter marinus TaxID=2776705 RepID=UPI001865BB07|nr:alpha/beta fold hydrolase [Luteolibacter marinus]
MRTVVLALLGLLASLGAAEIRRGEIGGAKFTVALPGEKAWQGKLVLLAHGYRPAAAPLGADLDVGDDFSRPLLAEGWAVATTSYRRNGWIVGDAIADLAALRDHIAREVGPVKRCLVVGNSMGGLIVTRIAEGALDGVDGVVAIGAYLGDGETEAYHPALTWQPKVPVLFLTNQDELEHPAHYVSAAGTERTAFWKVARDGHCNTSDLERLNALRAVDAWVDGKPPARERDGTVPPPRRPSTASAVEEGGLEGRVRLAHEAWGNLSTDLVAADLETLGLKRGDPAVVSAPGGKGRLEVTVVGFRSDVKPGKGALYVTVDGWVLVEINHGNAAKALGVKTGDKLRISK